MKTIYTVNVKYINGESVSFKNAADFSIMDQGVLFVEMPYVKDEDRLGRYLRSVKTTGQRVWIPLAQIKYIDVQTTRTITEPEEIKKYEKFLEHNIDITVTKISHTKAPSPEEVAKKIAEEEKTERKK